MPTCKTHHQSVSCDSAVLTGFYVFNVAHLQESGGVTQTTGTLSLLRLFHRPKNAHVLHRVIVGVQSMGSDWSTSTSIGSSFASSVRFGVLLVFGKYFKLFGYTVVNLQFENITFSMWSEMTFLFHFYFIYLYTYIHVVWVN